MHANDFWGDDQNADWWEGQDARYRERGLNKENEVYLLDSLKGSSFRSLLEVGSGTGRLIGALSRATNARCESVDINAELARRVAKRYGIKTHNAPVIKLPFPDNSFDFVFTFQVLQHVPNDQIEQALKEIERVAAKEYWLMEGYVFGKEQGERTHPASGGSFVYYHDLYKKPYAMDHLHQGKVRVYKYVKSS